MVEKLTGDDVKKQKIFWAEKKLRQAIVQNGPYSHNICGIVLSGVADVCGYEAANKLIDKFQLDDLYGIQKVTKEEL